MLSKVLRVVPFFTFIFSCLTFASIASQVQNEAKEDLLTESEEELLIHSTGDLSICGDFKTKRSLKIHCEGNLSVEGDLSFGGNSVTKGGMTIRSTGDLLIQSKNFIFVRHGHTPWGHDDILNGPQDLHLDAEGEKQADEAATFLNQNFTLKNPIIVTSPLARARETAQYIYDKLGKPVKVEEDGLKERYYGDYSKADPKNIMAYKPEDAEPNSVFEERVRQALKQILSTYSSSHGEVVLVSHQKVFQFLAKWLAHQDGIKLNQGGVCHFKVDDLDQTYTLQICR